MAVSSNTKDINWFKILNLNRIRIEQNLNKNENRTQIGLTSKYITSQAFKIKKNMKTEIS